MERTDRQEALAEIAREGQRAMNEYTPTTVVVKEDFIRARRVTGGPDEYDFDARTFDRWLAAHDAEIRADQRERDARTVEVSESPFHFVPDTETFWLSRDVLARTIRSVGEEKA